MNENNENKSEHIGDGLYMKDEGYAVSIAVNHHENKVAHLDIIDLDRAIKYLENVKQKRK